MDISISGIAVFALDEEEWLYHIKNLTRVYYQAYGYTMEGAHQVGLQLPDYILVRNDGWSMGCFEENLQSSIDLWKDMWVAIYKKGFNLLPEDE